MTRRLPVKVAHEEVDNEKDHLTFTAVPISALNNGDVAAPAVSTDKPVTDNTQDKDAQNDTLAAENMEQEPPLKRQKRRATTTKKHPTKYCCAIGCGKSEFETSFRRVPMIPNPLPPNATQARIRTFQSKLARRRELLHRLGLGGEDGRKDLRYCVSHDQSWAMKAFAVDKYLPYGDYAALKEKEIDKPLPPTGRELLIRVKAVATNAFDCKRLGNIECLQDRDDSDSQLVVGRDASGVVEEAGPLASLFQCGDDVMFAVDALDSGVFAEFVCVDERSVGPKPSSLTWSQAASVPLTTSTAWDALFERLNVPMDKELNSDKTILIFGGAGGVATAAVDIAMNLLGLTVIATGSREESIDYVRNLGALYVLNHHQKLAPQLNGFGIDQVDYILHCADLKQSVFDELVSLMKPSGCICSVWPSGTVVDMMHLFRNGINFSIVPMLRNTDREHQILGQVAKLLDEGVLRCRENRSLPLTADNLQKALTLQASAQCIGKTTLFFEG